MAYTEYGFGSGAVVASGSNDTRINNGRDEVNSNNGNEGGIRFIEDGVEFWFSASDTAAINKGVSQLRTDEFNGIDGSLYAQTSNQTDQNFPGGASDPALLVPPGDIYKLRPVDTGLSFVGTAAEPLTLVFGTEVGYLGSHIPSGRWHHAGGSRWAMTFESRILSATAWSPKMRMTRFGTGWIVGVRNPFRSKGSSHTSHLNA